MNVFYRMAVLLILAGVNLLFFAPHYFGHHVTEWDTYLYFFVNFLYFVDCLHSGIVPLWNHLVTSGFPFFAHSFHVSHYAPQKFLFALLATAVNPVRVFEVYTILPVFAGSAGFYLFFSLYSRQNRLIPLALSLLLSYSLFPPILGQVVFLYSLAALPFFLWCVHRTVMGEARVPHLMVLAIALAYWSTCGYAFLNICNLFCVATYGVLLLALNRDRLQSCVVLRLALFFGIFAAIYGMMMFPALAALKENFSELGKMYIPPDHRLRAASVLYQRAFGLKDGEELLDSLLGIGNLYWGKGLPFVVIFSLLLVPARLVVSTWRERLMTCYWLLIMAVFAAYAVKSELAYAVLQYLPFGQSNRWLTIGLYYVHIASVSLLAVQAGRAIDLREFWNTRYSYCRKWLLFFAAAGLSVSLLAVSRTGDYRYLLLLPVALLMVFPPVWLGKRADGVALCGAAVLSLLSMGQAEFNSGAEVAGRQIYEKVANRRQNVIIENNYRKVMTTEHYDPDNLDWIYRKVPTTDGYNNQGNPIFWYVKSYPLNREFFAVTDNFEMKPDLRVEQFPHPNLYAEALASLIPPTTAQATVLEKNPGITRRATVTYRIDQIEISPNRAVARVLADHGALLLYNQLYDRNWQVYVDGRRAENLRANIVYNGVAIPAGEHRVEYVYMPLAMNFIYSAHLSSLLCLIMAWILFKRQPPVARFASSVEEQ